MSETDEELEKAANEWGEGERTGEVFWALYLDKELLEEGSDDKPKAQED